MIRHIAPDEWATYKGIRLRALADSPDAFCSTLAEEQVRTPAAWEDRLAAAAISGKDCPLIAEVDGRPVGMVWAKVDPGSASVVNVFQMWVAPEGRGRGVGAALLEEATAWARSKHARVFQLGVTCGDSPAYRLYLRAGFEPVGAPEPQRPGSALFIQNMRKQLA